MKAYKIRGKKITLPIYFPDATKGVVRSLDSTDLIKSKIEGLVLNTYHLSQQPGTSLLKSYGGVKNFMSWDGIVATDSGGFQLFSMIQQNSALGKINRNGLVFYRKTEKGKKKYTLTPEKSIQTQFAIDSDIMICLDYFTPPNGTQDEAQLSVDHTISWAKRCKDEFLKQVEQRKLSEDKRPKLFAVLQGGKNRDEVERCADNLLEIGFDGFGLGGFHFDENDKLDLETISFYADQTPDDFPRFALGVGYPDGIADCFKLGFTIFDCVLPTRDARHHRLYTFTIDPRQNSLLDTTDFYRHLYILKEKYFRDERPISDFCDCTTCQNYSRAYLHHLFRIEDATAWRLATIHNLRTYTLLIENLRKYGQH